MPHRQVVSNSGELSGNTCLVTISVNNHETKWGHQGPFLGKESRHKTKRCQPCFLANSTKKLNGYIKLKEADAPRKDTTQDQLHVSNTLLILNTECPIQI